MKKTWPYILLLLIVLFVLFRASRKVARRDIIWKDDYTQRSHSPLGCYVYSRFIDEMMDGQTETTDKTAYVQLADSNYRKSNYIFVNNEFNASNQDADQLCRYVIAGNTVFISAHSFGFLADTLRLSLTDPLYYTMDEDSVNSLGNVMNTGSQSVEANLVNPSLHFPKNIRFDHTTFAPVFSHVDTARTTLLGTDGHGRANFIRVKLGKGQFYLHTLPDAFGNYYSASANTAPYLFRILSYLPVQQTILDTHYKSGRVENTDPRRYIFSEPALRLAYFVLIIAGMIALLFGGKRRQRPVPVIAPPTNTTLEFVEQVGVLYYRKGSHLDIARKKALYFLENIRSRFYVQTNHFDDRFLERIVNLSGISAEKIRHLFATISQLQTRQNYSEKELKHLEQIIREFNQLSKR
jgi:hypothetical protein